MTEDFETYARITLRAIERKLDALADATERLADRARLHEVEIARLKTVQNIWTGLIAAAVSAGVAVAVRALT